MGELVIEVPQNVNLKFSVKNAEVVEEILRLVKNQKRFETIELDYPYDLDDVDADSVLGIWSDNEETADEIARRVRAQNRRTT